ncbi:MAG: sulfatase/phosphatase domain-containing protein, partial [Vicinamibacterales bacterium]
SVYDEEVRVPLLLHWPGRITPGRVDEPVHHVDLAPTILALAGLTDTQSQFQGRSLWPRDPAWRPSPVVLTRFVYPEDLDSPVADRTEAHAIVDYPWKLIVFERAGTRGRAELYRLDTDPGERRDLASVDGARVKALLTALDRFMAGEMQRRARFDADHARSSPRPSTPPSRDLLDQLRSLGYVR